MLTFKNSYLRQFKLNVVEILQFYYFWHDKLDFEFFFGITEIVFKVIPVWEEQITCFYIKNLPISEKFAAICLQALDFVLLISFL